MRRPTSSTRKKLARRAQPTMEIGATLREMAWTQMMNGVVRVGFWTQPHRGVLLNFANNRLVGRSELSQWPQQLLRWQRSIPEGLRVWIGATSVSGIL